jgi:hypothetical protein
MHHRLVLCLYNDQHCKSSLTIHYYSLLPNYPGCIQHCQFLKDQTLPDDWPGNQNKEVVAGPATVGSSNDGGSSPVAVFTLGSVALVVVAVTLLAAFVKVRRRRAPPTHALHPRNLMLAACDSPDDDLPSFPGRMT